LRVCGLKPGLFTSPHILSLRERIRINGKEISKKDLNRLVNKIRPQAKKFNITFFEAVTAVAFLYFLEKKIDCTVLEVGLGGRLDATNVVNPKVSVITKIGYDHTEILGKTLPKIAKEKAGIIHPASISMLPKTNNATKSPFAKQFENRDGVHPGSYVVFSSQKPSVLKVLKEKIKTTKNKYCDTAKEFQIKNVKTDLAGSEFTIEQRAVSERFRINLVGEHQIENARTALATLLYLKKQDSRITIDGIKKGFERTRISARCQVVSKEPLIIVDGAHNPESAKSLSDVIKNIVKQKVIIIFGSSQGKLVKVIFKTLTPVTKQFILTQSENPRALSSKELALILKEFAIPYETTKSVPDAVKLGLASQKGKTPLVITGSFYVASEALQSPTLYASRIKRFALA
jgi:dihydrofolate synthase/folylpolyglutamate synthase